LNTILMVLQTVKYSIKAITTSLRVPTIMTYWSHLTTIACNLKGWMGNGQKKGIKSKTTDRIFRSLQITLTKLMHATKLFIATMALSVFTLAYGQTYPGGPVSDVEKWVREIRQEYNLVKSRISTLEKDGYAGELFLPARD